MAVRKKQVPDLEEYRAMAYYRLSKDDKNEDRAGIVTVKSATVF